MKILMVGPAQTGKTTIANFVSDFASHLGSPEAPYRPTQGCR